MSLKPHPFSSRAASAALRSNTRRRRSPNLPLLQVPSPVEEAPPSIADALQDEIGTIKLNNVRYEVDMESLEQGAILGNGQFGVVKAVKHIPTSTEMAVKLIRDSLKPDQRKQMISEVRLSLSFEHTNLVSYYGVNFLEGDIQLYMERCELNLSDVIDLVTAAGKIIPEDMLGKIAASVSCYGMRRACMHACFLECERLSDILLEQTCVL
eukprot:TRINITY_DN10753_c0_g1_i4.p1 TRINITY_DN10753_c0_g1~~TRINITY_DN10753_c0_g1_i4.p1  ORF type:complete len:210 (+),score=37.19 TRINITY_DN10753_c0_g1_i4:595-1224(+)